MDKDYFVDYCGGGSYDENYIYHSRVVECIDLVDRLGLEMDSVLVLGAATGRVLEHFNAAWDIRPHGCEISRWAHRRIPAGYRDRIRCMDMRRYVANCVRKRKHFDLLFSNSLVYLAAAEVPEFLVQCAEVSDYFHFWSSTSEDHEPNDSYRQTLKPRAWWGERFREAGFRGTRSPYLWRTVSA